MSAPAPRCTTCGRLMHATVGGFCSSRCADLASEGYSAPAFHPSALAAPSTRFDGRVIVESELPAKLPEGCVHIGSAGTPEQHRELVRISAEEWDAFERALNALRAATDGRVTPFTLQELVPGGLEPASPPRRKGATDDV